MVIRIVQTKSPEASCDGARKAVNAERGKMEKRSVWDTSDVYSLRDLYKTPNFSECMLGRVFQILGIKGDEMAEDDPERIWKARIVFQGSNVHTKTGTPATEWYEEVSNALASFAAARCWLAVGAMKGFASTLRDAESAYLQALIDTPTRIPTFIELPEAWWPDTWFFDETARQQPRYVRPHCNLKGALCGHLEAGALWDKTLLDIMVSEAASLCIDVRRRLWSCTWTTCCYLPR